MLQEVCLELRCLRNVYFLPRAFFWIYCDITYERYRRTEQIVKIYTIVHAVLNYQTVELGLCRISCDLN